MQTSKHHLLIWFLIVAILFFGLGHQAGRNGWQLSLLGLGQQNTSFSNIPVVVGQQPPAGLVQNIDFSLFWKVWQKVSEQYLDRGAVDAQKMFYGAISGMVQSVGDPYTVFLTPDQNKGVREELSGSFDGVGIQLGYRDKQLVVIAPLKGTPADKAGVRAQDAIAKIGDKDTFNMTLPEAVSLIRGKKGTKIKLTLVRQGQDEPIVVELTRDTIKIKSVEVQFLENNIAWVKLSRFGEDTNKEWDGAVDEMVKNNAKGVILDVRNNPGGLLEVAIHIASDFLDGGVVLQRESAGSVKEPIGVVKKGKLLNIPVVAMVNKGSASASEIVAGALQDRGRAKLVGEQSFGKGTVQDSQDLEKGAGLHITIARWLLPSGKWINSTGLTPDYKVEISEDDAKGGRDPQLDRAKELLK